MHKQIYINLPVGDLTASTTFFKSLGFDFNPQFSNDQAACMIISENIYAMLLVHDFFKQFTGKPISDAKQSTEVLICVSCDSRKHVDELVAKAVAAGGQSPRPPQDHGFMYGHGFEDIDGHIWELMYMDPTAGDA
jgi:predicted lactoylglutathione lyase